MSRLELTYPDPSWSIAFLEGHEGLTVYEERFRTACERLGARTHLVDGLYPRPERIVEAARFNAWSLVTTGQNQDGLARIVGQFKALGYVPQRIVFPLGEDEFVGFINALKLRGKAEFYRVFDEGDASLIRLTYLDN